MIAAPAAPSVAFEATPKQEELYATVFGGEATIIGFGGGVRGTKTWGLLSLFILLCRIYPGSRWCVVRKDLERIRKNTLPSYEKLRQLTGGWMGPVAQAGGNAWESQAANGSAILFFGENIDKDPDLSRWKGLEVNGFGLEEGDELAEASLWKAVERAGAWVVPGDGEQPLPWVVVTFNPNESWPARLFYEPWQAGTIAAPYAFIPATMEDNPYAPESYRANLKHLPKDQYARFVAADWSVIRGQFYDVRKEVHTIRREELPDPLPAWWEYWGSYDWGFAHWAVYCAWARDGDGTTYLLDSAWMKGEQDDDMARTIVGMSPARCLGEVYAGHDCWEERKARGAPGIATADIFADCNIALVRADTGLVNGARAVRHALHVRDGRPRLRVVDTPNNLRGLAQLATIKPDPKNAHKPLKVNADSHGNGGDDFADAFRYGLATRMAIPEEPYPGAEVLAARAKLDTISRREDEEWDRMVKRLNKGRRS